MKLPLGDEEAKRLYRRITSSVSPRPHARRNKLHANSIRTPVDGQGTNVTGGLKRRRGPSDDVRSPPPGTWMLDSGTATKRVDAEAANMDGSGTSCRSWKHQCLLTKMWSCPNRGCARTVLGRLGTPTSPEEETSCRWRLNCRSNQDPLSWRQGIISPTLIDISL